MDKLFRFSPIFSSFKTVSLLFKCRFVACQRGLPRKFADCVFVLINNVLLNLLCAWISMEKKRQPSTRSVTAAGTHVIVR